jgi:hypothetical protein
MTSCPPLEAALFFSFFIGFEQTFEVAGRSLKDPLRNICCVRLRKH